MKAEKRVPTPPLRALPTPRFYLENLSTGHRTVIQAEGVNAACEKALQRAKLSRHKFKLFSEVEVATFDGAAE